MTAPNIILCKMSLKAVSGFLSICKSAKTEQDPSADRYALQCVRQCESSLDGAAHTEHHHSVPDLRMPLTQPKHSRLAMPGPAEVKRSAATSPKNIQNPSVIQDSHSLKLTCS